jgi:hypothetical protein
VILYILLTGIPPFAADSDEQSFKLTRAGRYDPANLREVRPVPARQDMSRPGPAQPDQRARSGCERRGRVESRGRRSRIREGGCSEGGGREGGGSEGDGSGGGGSEDGRRD